MSKKKQYCSNCNKYGHTNKECNEPITSAGVICLCLDNNIKSYFLNNDIDNISNDINIYNYQRLSNINKIKLYKNKMKFLLVQRKHSLNYINFIRGIYDENDYTQLEKTFSLMSNDEINQINDNDFDYLWNNLWNKTAKKKIYQKEYNESKIKFNKISELGYISQLHSRGSEYNTPEWEFPKGRKNINESNYECAIREFYEETGIEKENYEIINGINSIHDDFTGTNNMKYKHIFYIGFLKNKDILYNDMDIGSKNEIKESRWCSWDEALRLFRPYYNNKINMLNKLFLFFINLSEENNICNTI